MNQYPNESAADEIESNLTERATLLAPSSAGAASIRPATMDDLALLDGLDSVSFDEKEHWSQGQWADEITAHDGRTRITLVAEVEGNLSGAISISRQFETVDLLRVMVDPLQRRQGLGSRLIHEATWFTRDADRVLLEVRHDNAAAVMVYARLGFKAIDRRDDYYGEGLHALVMESPLPWAAHR